MAIKHRYSLGGILWAGLLIVSLVIPPAAIAQDTAAGRELFEREWAFVDHVPTITPFESTRRMPQRRNRGHDPWEQDRGIGRGPRPAPFEENRERNSMRLADGQEFPADGLGPLYNAVSCAACHPGGGAAGVNHNVTLISVDPESAFLDPSADRRGRGPARNSITDLFPALGSGNTLSFNAIVHDHSTRPGYDAIRQRLSVGVPNGIPPEWFSPPQRTLAAITEQPVVAGRYGAIDYYLSQRNSPPLYGMGDIEKVSMKRLKAISLNQPRSSGGVISGRVAGKYGWRGQVNTLSDFVTGACASELGLNVADIARQADDPADPRYFSLAPDISTTEVADLTSYVAELPAPPKQLMSLESRKQARRGEQVFKSIGCAACHIADLPPARGIYSDLLLHDLGTALQDPFPAPVEQPINQNVAATTSPYSNRYGRVETPSYRAGASTNRHRSAPRGNSRLGPQGSAQTMATYYAGQPQIARGDFSKDDLASGHQFSPDVLQREW
ncbi:hypothetical protein, partial [Novipirellula sp.]|uniref:hypothetical protein n=1 Tax=Novipirellula sp. TaxID=2795430 RepID=UPI0035615E57